MNTACIQPNLEAFKSIVVWPIRFFLGGGAKSEICYAYNRKIRLLTHRVRNLDSILEAIQSLKSENFLIVGPHNCTMRPRTGFNHQKFRVLTHLKR
jgi:hypothetical protein